MEIKLFNTLSYKKEVFRPIKERRVGMYTCGPTVYDYAHLGNLRTYIFEDLLRRVLKYNGYQVKHVMNITDVGHLTSDADSGEDKMESSAQKQKKTVWEIAQFYTKEFKKDLKLLNIKKPTIWIKATQTIKEQIEFIKKMQKKGFVYIIEDGVYFDSEKLSTYGRLWKTRAQHSQGEARVAMVKGKKRPTDFALWKFSPKDKKRQMEWDSPWGRGFPGWHTECVVMSIKELGIPFDIHCGGVDHIPVHHTNEIAQAEAVYGKVLAHFWLHGEFLILEEKMSKSKGNIIILKNLIEKGYNPLSFRYLCLTAHYRSKLKFTWENLKAAERALNKILEVLINQASRKEGSFRRFSKRATQYQKQFLKIVNDDLDMPGALALLWQALEDKDLSQREKYFLLIEFDKVFGLGFADIGPIEIPKEIEILVQRREEFRQREQWERADELRKKIEEKGFRVEDTPKGPRIKPLLKEL